MKKIGIVDVRTRLRNIPEGEMNLNRATTFREQADKAIRSGFPSHIIFCIESGIGDTSASMTEDTMYDLLDALAEVGTESQIRKYGNLILREYVSKTRDAKETLKYMKQKLGRAKSKVTTKIQNNFDDLWDATNSTIGSAKDNFKKNTEPYKNAIANAKTRAKQAGHKLKSAMPKKEEALVEVYEAMVDQATKIVSIDRILENYNRLSKRFNIDRIIQENTVTNDVADTCVEICALVDTYDMPVKARFNTALETVWYGLHKNGFTFNESELVTTISDFYMASGGNSFACKSILEVSMIFDKGDYMGDIDVITEEEPEEDAHDESTRYTNQTYFNEGIGSALKSLFDGGTSAKKDETNKKFREIMDTCDPKVQKMNFRKAYDDWAFTYIYEEYTDDIIDTYKYIYATSMISNNRPPKYIMVCTGKDFNREYGLKSDAKYDDKNFFVCAPLDIVPDRLIGAYKSKESVRYFTDVVDNAVRQEMYENKSYKPKDYISMENIAAAHKYLTGEEWANESAISYEYMVEGKLSAKERKNIKDSDYGIPSKRKYPMPDESHVRSAIQMFNHVDSADEAELARNIKKKIKQYGMSVDVGEKNRFSKYYKPANENGVISAAVREYATYNSGYPVLEDADGDKPGIKLSDSDFDKILNDYKTSNDTAKQSKLMSVVRKLYSLKPKNAIEGTPSLLSYLRNILVIGGFAINPVVGVISFIADQVATAHYKREEVAEMREAFKAEIRKTDKKIDSTKSQSQKDNLTAYRKALTDAYNKIDEYYEGLLTDKELDDKYDAADDDDIKAGGGSFGDAELDAFEDMFGDDFDDDFGDFDDMEGFEESGKFVVLMGNLYNIFSEDCEEKSFDQHKCRKMIRMNPSIVGDLAKITDKYPQIISKHDLTNAIDDVRSDIQIGAVRINMIERYDLNNTYDELMRSPNTIIEQSDIFTEAKRFAAQIEITKALNEIYSACVYYSPLTEASFTNSLKLAGEKLKKGIQKASDADKTISKNIDSAMSSFTRSAERAMTNDRRDAIIRGSVIPSASKVIKGAIMAGATTLVLGPAVAVIGVLGYLGMSKKLNDKQRKALIDEIEIELKMCQKYIDLAESKNDLKALKKLYTIQRELEKQRAKIKYKIGLKGERYHSPESMPTDGIET